MASRLIDLISKKTNCTCSTLFFLISKKTNLHVQHAFCLSLPLFCTTTTLFCRTKTSNFLVTHYFCVFFMFAFIFHCCSFLPCWPLAFLIVSQPLWIFMFFFLQNSSLLFSITSSVIHVSGLNYFTLVCLWCGRTLGWSVGRSVYGHVITKFSWMGSGPHFLNYRAPRRTVRARKNDRCELLQYICI